MTIATFDIKGARAGAVAVVSLSGVESDVLLMTPSDASAYLRGQRVHYRGGHYTSSPARISIPHAGDWRVLVVPRGGRVHATLQVV